MPQDLQDFERRVRPTDYFKNRATLREPWIAYSDRGNDFGTKYYVTDENVESVFLHAASGHDPRNRRLFDPKPIGWRNKSELFLYFGAEFTDEGTSLIHKKCVILNNKEVVEKIAAGEMSESEVPFYHDPFSKKIIGNVPLYFIYFVYKTENDRLLIGKNYRCPVDQFNTEIIGWIDKDRIHEYNTRICFEPNYLEDAVAFRKCNEDYKSRVFERLDFLLEYMKGDVSYSAMWEEPDYFFFRNPGYRPRAGIPLEWPEGDVPDSLFTKLCGFKDDLNKITSSQILTNEPLPGDKFRFPLIRGDDRNRDDNIYLIGVAGRQQVASPLDEDCEERHKHKREINVFFISDYNLGSFPVRLGLNLINQDYQGFSKTYGLSFYPRTKMRDHVDLGAVGQDGRTNNYRFTLDFVNRYQQTTSARPDDNFLSVLNDVLVRQSFDKFKTNIIIVFSQSAAPEDEFRRLQGNIQQKLAENNIYLLAVDYSKDRKFSQQIKTIAQNANQLFAESYGLKIDNSGFLMSENIEFMYSSQLALVSHVGDLSAEAIERIINQASNRIIMTIDNFISDACGNKQQSNSGTIVNREDYFAVAQRALIASPSTNLEFVRYLQEGYIARRYNSVQTDDTWRAAILFTRDELHYMTNAMKSAIGTQLTPAERSQALYDMFVELFNRFVGEPIPMRELRNLAPQQIMTQIVGGTYGIDLTHPLKRKTLREIQSNDQSLQEHIDSYTQQLRTSLGKLSDILQGNVDLRFTIDPNCTNDSDCIEYYWVPFDRLP